MNSCTVNEIFKGVDFSDAEFDIAQSKFEKISVRKGEILLRAGQSVPYQYYVHDGCMRTYHVTDTGKDVTIQFAIKDWWISDYTAFFTGGKSVLNIECIQDAIVYRLARQSMEELYVEVPGIESFFRIKMERFFGSFQRRILSDLALSAKDKYKTFLKAYPNIEKHIKNYHLASYLGITTESLSRIRHELAHE